MGLCHAKKRQQIRLQHPTECPRCGRYFPPGISYQFFNQHLDSCLQMENHIHQTDQIAQKSPLQQEINISFWEKQDDDQHWEKKVSNIQNINLIQSISFQEIISHSFFEKQIWFRMRLEYLRVPWQEGCTQIEVSIANLLESSSLAFDLPSRKLHGEVKIRFIEDRQVQDAGGVMRELFCMISTEMVNSKLLIKSSCSELSYRFSSVVKPSEYKLFGIIVGKAIFERINLNCFLARPLIKILLGQAITLDDFKFYDEAQYSSFSYILENEFDPIDLMLDFSIEVDGQIVNLVENGQGITVTNENKKEYIDLVVKYLTYTQYQTNIEEFLKGVHTVIPKQILTIFNTLEIEMLLFGLPFIDVKDWKKNTTYKGICDNQVVDWFWESLNTFTQEELSKFLHFCTGSGRTPIEGFKKLQSNRGEISLFCIETIAFQDSNPYPKAHTCFNRLELPIYNTKEDLDIYLRATLNNILVGQFGLE